MKAWVTGLLALGLFGCSQYALQSGYSLQKPDSTRTAAAPSADANATAEEAKGSNEVTDNTDKSKDTTSTNNTPTVTPTNTATPPVPATGSVTVNLTLIPPTPAGTYRNRGHVRTIFVTDANDKYLKTIHAFAGVRSINLKRWMSFTNNTADATTGATQTTPAAGVPIAATWDLKDKAGAGMMTGNYKLWLEFVEANTPALDQGKKPSDPAQAIDNVNGYEYLIVPFTVSAQGSMKTDSSNAVFKDVAVKHVT